MSCYRCDKNKKYNITLTQRNFNHYHLAMSYINNTKKDKEVIAFVKMKLENFIADATGICVCVIRDRIKNG